MPERMGDREAKDIALEKMLVLADHSPNRILQSAAVLIEIRQKYLDFDDSCWREAIALLLVSGEIRLGRKTATFEVAPVGMLFEVPNE